MSLSLSHGKQMDPGDVGIQRADMPPLADTPEASRIDLDALWPADRAGRPRELEIGSGKGTFLVQQAALMPDTNFLGIEYARAFWLYAADRVRRHALPNVRLLHDDAGVFVRWCVADATFDRVHIYFPDPWPKKRHHKRRLITDDFFKALHRVLTPGGLVRIVTDHDDYFAWIQEHAARVTNILKPVDFDTTNRADGAQDEEVVGTNFERKYRREGRPFNTLALQRQD